jgi:O-glycosyl hydrolase
MKKTLSSPLTPNSWGTRPTEPFPFGRKGWTGLPRWGASFLLALALSVFTMPARADTTASVTVNPDVHGQVLEGWGTSLCWWANIVGGYSPAARRDYLDKIFDVKRGLGLNIVRYNIGGGENPAIPDTLALRARVRGFEPSPGVWDWSADANQRRILLESRRKGVNLEEAFSNSPPYWMTISGSVAGAPDGGSNLKPEDYDAFADYLTQVVQHYHDVWSVTFRTLEPMNESANYWWKKGGSQEGCHFDARNPAGDDQNALVKKVAADLRKRGLSTVVSASDDNTIDTTLASLNVYDPQALSDVGQINTHTYGGSKRTELKAFADRLGKRVWVSEHGDGDETGVTMAQDIVASFRQMGVTGWVYWQAVDAGGWGLLNQDPNKTKALDYTLNEKYYVMGQYSRYLRPGDQMIGISDDGSLAAYRGRTKMLVLVSANFGNLDKPLTYDLSRFAHVGPMVTACQTSSTEHWASLPLLALAQGHLTVTLPPNSVTTYVFKDAALVKSVGAYR